jgi:uncharacterized protein DUF397
MPVIAAVACTRDSKDPDGPRLAVTRGAFAGLVAGLKSADR